MLFGCLSEIVSKFLDISLFGNTLVSISPLHTITILALSIPSISVTTRRLHDIGKSGWWQLIWITVISAFFLIYWLIRESDANKNSYDVN